MAPLNKLFHKIFHCLCLHTLQHFLSASQGLLPSAFIYYICSFKGIQLARQLFYLGDHNLQLHGSRCKLVLWRYVESVNKLSIDLLQSLSLHVQLDSRLLCNAMGHHDWPKSTHYNTLGMHFSAVLLKKKQKKTVIHDRKLLHPKKTSRLFWRLTVRSFSSNTRTM